MAECRRGRGGAVLLARGWPEHRSEGELLARLAVLFSSGHRLAERVFGEGYEARLPVLAAPDPAPAPAPASASASASAPVLTRAFGGGVR